MIDFTVTVEGERDLDLLWSSRVIPALGAGCREGVDRGMKEGMAQAKASHPYTDRTGDLTRETSTTVYAVTVNGAAGEMVWLMPYAGFVENGTSRSRAYPFAGPALLKVAAVAEVEIELGVARAARILWEGA